MCNLATEIIAGDLAQGEIVICSPLEQLGAGHGTNLLYFGIFGNFCLAFGVHGIKIGMKLNFGTMIANIPLSLTECLAPREVGELLAAASEQQRPVEDLVVFALRDYLQARRKPTQPEGAGREAAMAA